MTLNQKESRTKLCKNGEIRRIDVFESGRYTVKRLTVFEGETITYRTYNVAGQDEYLPEIFYEDGIWTKEKPTFEIQTASYGPKGIEDIKAIIEGYQEAIKVVEVLIKNFC